MTDKQARAIPVGMSWSKSKLTRAPVHTDWGSKGKEWYLCYCGQRTFLSDESTRRAQWRNVQPVVGKMVNINTQSGMISVFHKHSDGRITYVGIYDADSVNVDKNYVTMHFGKDFPL